MPEHERDNYYILLELEFDPPVTDQGRIKAALRAKKQEWTRWQDNPGKRNAGLSYLGMAQDIEKTLLDPAQREKEAAAAKEEKREMLSQFEAELRVLESKGYILPREAAAIAVKYKAYGVRQEAIPEYAKCPIAEEPPQKDEDEGEVIDRLAAKNIQRNLKILGHPTLYAFLGEPPYSSVKKLLAAAEQKRRAASNQGTKSSQATVSQELAGICVSMFESILAKQKYDRYLKVSRYPAVGELLDEEYARSQYVAPEVLLRIVNFAVEKYGIKILEAEEYIKNYCNAYDIPLDARGASIKCPSCNNKTPRGGLVCTVCAQPLAGDCPACGEPFEGGPAICPACGFSLGDMVKALRHLSDAETALIENNWSTAQRNLQYVKMYWPNHPRLVLLEKRAALLEERYASYVNQLEDCVKHRQLYAAKELIDEAAGRHLRLPSQRVKHVAEQLAAFEYRLERIPAKNGEPDIDQLLRLSLDVTDSIELGRLLAAYPPEPPESVSAKVSGRSVNVTWGLSASAESYAVTYLLVRKKDSLPLTAFDGDLLYEGPSNSFADKSPEPLVKYYYCVFTRRAGTYSRTGVSSEPVLVAPEVSGLQILPVDGGAHLKWQFNPDVREIMIWRKLGGDAPTEQGDGILLENDRLDGFTDIKLKNEVEYWYYIVAVYVVAGARIYSKGVCGSVIPRKMVAPLDDVNISPTDTESVYIVNWNAAQHSDILLFCSSKKPGFRTGDIVAVEELMTLYRKVDLNYKQADSAQFKLGTSGGMYLFVAAVFGRFATVCEPRYLVNVADVENPVCENIGGNLYIDMKWPLGVTGVAVAYRFDHFPGSPEEPGAITVNRTRAQYDVDAAVIITEPEQEVYHMAVFAVYTMPDGKKAYSKGVRLLVNNRPRQDVLYSFEYKKKRFSGTGILEVALSSDNDFTMPKAVIVGKIGRLPLSRSDGLPLFEMEKEIRVEGTVSLQYTTSPLPPNLYVRIFLHDESMYEKFRLLPSLPVKIT